MASVLDRIDSPFGWCPPDGVADLDAPTAVDLFVDWSRDDGAGENILSTKNEDLSALLCSKVSVLLQRHHERMEQRLDLWMARQEHLLETTLYPPLPSTPLAALGRPATSVNLLQGFCSSPASATTTNNFSPALAPWTRHDGHRPQDVEQINEPKAVTEGKACMESKADTETKAQCHVEQLSEPKTELKAHLTAHFEEVDYMHEDQQEAMSESMSNADLPVQEQVNSRKRAARRLNTLKGKHLESQEGGFMGYLKRIVLSHHFEILCGFFIISNAVFIGAEVNYLAESGAETSPPQLYVCQHVFTIIFLIEWLLRVVVHNCSFFSGDQCFWHIFDTVIVSCSMFEAVLDILSVSGSYGTDPLDNVGSLRIVRIVRITRLIRIFRISRIVRFIQALRTLVYSIMCTLKSLIWALMLLAMIIYCFGIVFTQAVVDYSLSLSIDDTLSKEEKHLPASLVKWWGTLPDSMFTLFMSIVGGISWIDAIRPFFEVSSFPVAMFLVYIAFTYFAVLNVVTAVFCQSAIESAQRDQDLVVNRVIDQKQEYVADIQQLFKRIDNDDSGTITMEEFEQHIQDDAVRAYFSALELETSDALEFFKLLDTDRKEEIDIEEFVMGCLRMKGPAKGIDLARLLHEHKRMVKLLALFIEQSGGPSGHQHSFLRCSTNSFGFAMGNNVRSSTQSIVNPDEVDVLI